MHKRHAQKHGGFFDLFAQGASRFASHAPFFVACVGLVLLWLLSYPLFGSVDTWQLVINTATTIVTFLMVALLQNSRAGARRRCTRSSTRSRTRSPT
jgi:low affinity Fe/Cu permease